MKGTDPSVYVFTVYVANAFMPLRTSPCAKAGSAAAETNGAMELMRMVLLGLTAAYYTISAAVKLRCGRNPAPAQLAANRSSTWSFSGFPMYKFKLHDDRGVIACVQRGRVGDDLVPQRMDSLGVAGVVD